MLPSSSLGLCIIFVIGLGNKKFDQRAICCCILIKCKIFKKSSDATKTSSEELIEQSFNLCMVKGALFYFYMDSC